MKRAAILLAVLLFCLSVVVACDTGDDDDNDDSGDDDDAGDDDDDSFDGWSPPPGTTWQWQLTGTIDASYDVAMYDIDLFDAPDAVIDTLHDDGKIVICYFSAGSFEDWREDAGDFPQDALGEPLEDWEGERWLDVRVSGVRDVMENRLDYAVSRGCDGVEPDNVDGYQNDTGFDLDEGDQLDYNRFLASSAHARGLSVGLKNDVDQLDDLAGRFDWALNEECHQYDECGAYDAFLDRGKAVFHVEYVDDFADAGDLAGEVCGNYPGFSTLIKTWDLGSEYLACGG